MGFGVGRLLGYGVLFVVLTVITQTGGVVLLLSLLLRTLAPPRSWWRLRYIFPVLYGLIWLVTPLLAQPFDRVPLPLYATPEKPLQPQNLVLVLANRHYVRPALRAAVLEVAREVAARQAGVPLSYLDATFPLLDDFPLLPHKGHDNGRKLDLSFRYRNAAGELASRAPSFFGYGRSTGPRATEMDYPATCAERGYWQYSLLPRIARPFVREGYAVDDAASAEMVRALADHPTIGKLFLEPHLKERWDLGRYPDIRYHGCWAVRHDDHVHIQL
jgi:hypothetical protein